MQSYRYLLLDPGPSGVGHDDSEVRKIGCHIVYTRNGSTIFQLEAAATRHSGTRYGEPCMEEDRNLQFSAFYLQRVKVSIVGEEALVYRVQLEPPQTQLLTATLYLMDGSFPLPRINRGEPNKLVGIISDNSGDIVVSVRRFSGGSFSIN